MQNLGLCENLADMHSAMDRGEGQRLQSLAEKARKTPGGEEEIKQLARDFSQVFYTQLLKQMQKTIDRSEDSAMSEGVTGFVNMYLPKTMAAAENDPLTSRIQSYLDSQLGEEAGHQEAEHEINVVS